VSEEVEIEGVRVCINKQNVVMLAMIRLDGQPLDVEVDYLTGPCGLDIARTGQWLLRLLSLDAVVTMIPR
jgi:hypothetical protein